MVCIAVSVLKSILLSKKNHMMYREKINIATKRDSLEKIFFQSIKKIDTRVKRYILSSNRWLPRVVKKGTTNNRCVFEDMLFVEYTSSFHLSKIRVRNSSIEPLRDSVNLVLMDYIL